MLRPEGHVTGTRLLFRESHRGRHGLALYGDLPVGRKGNNRVNCHVDFVDDMWTPCERPTGGHDVPMRRLLPDPADDLEVDTVYAAPLGRHRNRPWVSLSMVSSIDGSTVVAGRSGELSSATDSAVLAQLRSLADVIVVGAGTVRQEGYGPPRKPGQRIGVVTSTGDVDTTAELFTSGAGFLISPEDADHVAPNGIDVLRAGTGRVDLAMAIERLAAVTGDCSVVQAEGGAALNGALAQADVLDELNITTSPATVGGGGPRLTDRAADHTHRYELAQLAVDDEQFLYARWLRRR